MAAELLTAETAWEEAYTGPLSVVKFKECIAGSVRIMRAQRLIDAQISALQKVLTMPAYELTPGVIHWLMVALTQLREERKKLEAQ